MSDIAMTSLPRPGWREALSRLGSSALIHVFFFVSGIPALVYQLCWQRMLFRMFGINMESVTIVVTAFMLGLGVGSLLGSTLALRRSFPPLLLIAVIELSIGTFGAFSPHLFELADPFVAGLSLPAQVAAALGLLFIPTALMGMTLPLLVGYFITRSSNVGLSTGSLYRVNTLGAVVGCLVAAFVFFPFLGLDASIFIAAGLNGGIGLCALVAFLAVRTAPAGPVPVAAIAQTGEGLISYRAGLLLAFAAGFVSLSYEIFLIRLTAFVSRTDNLQLTLTLAVFLMGIACGAQLAADWCARATGRGGLLTKILGALGASGLLGLLLLPALAHGAMLGQGLVVIILFATFLIALSLGAIFPLLAHFAVPPDRRSGGRVGLILLSDILGSAAGSLLTGFVLSDLLDAHGLAVVLSLLTFAVAAPFAWMAAHRKDGLKPARAVMVAGAALLLMAFQAPLSAGLMDAMLYKSLLGRLPPLVRVVENRDGIIAVSGDGTVFGGGAYDGRFSIDPVHDVNGIIRPFSLSLFHPHPRDVLMIGLASGSWAQVVAGNPEVAHFTIVEINPGYLPLIREQREVASLLDNPKVSIVIDDGRRWLKRHPQARFDAVVANTTYHFRANATNVLSREFNAMIRAHLKPGGIYMFNATDSLRAARTGCESFAHGYRVLNNLVLSDAPFDLDAARWRANLLATRIDGRPALDVRRPLDRAALENMLSLPRDAERPGADARKARLESCASVLARTQGLRTITDDNMGTEWRFPLGFE